MKKVLICLFASFTIFSLSAQTQLKADGRSDTYELINNMLAPGYDILAVPDCSHADFGKHIDQVFDQELNQYVFRFHAHSNEDNDECQHESQQRCEIKVTQQSPTSLLGAEKETITYTWKFKLGADFIPSKKFTYLHQLHALGGEDESTPLFALNAHKGTSDQLSLIYANGDRNSVLLTKELEPFKGTWISATETITFGEIGAYQIELKNVDTGDVLFSYKKEAIQTWKTDASCVCPSWGIFRSLDSEDEIKDEIVVYSDITVEKSDALSTFRKSIDRGDISIFPNPTSTKANIKGDLKDYDHVVLCDSFGKEIQHKVSLLTKTVDLSQLKNGIYFVVFKKDNKISSVKKILKL
ncbi:T9SS type A sorting domain-containing protein [Flavobacteriaceae bacterium F08102]|nr:T9SS type A sorting domain-containing protein [Flavobacteriaceae bacterium F08102]